MNKLKSMLGTVLMVAVTAVVADPASIAAGQKQYQLTVPPQLVTQALKDFARQTKLQVVYYTDIAEGVASPGVRGALAANEALTQILDGTGLGYLFLNERTVAIRAIGVASVTTGAGDGAAEPVHLAQTETSSPSKGEGQGEDKDKELSSGASASAEAEKRMISEVVVTAQKRKENLQEVPISISVVTGADLDKSSAQGTTEILSRVPGIAVSEGVQGGGTMLTVRGVTAAGPIAGGASPVAYYIDSVPFGFISHAFAPDPNPYDLERIEVLRGPQGTLYGAGGAGGVVRVLTNDANLDAFELKARTSMSSTEDGGENYRGDLAVNVPIVDEKLAVRAVLGYNNLSGWINAPNKQDLNDAQLTNTRIKVRAQPAENLSIDLSAWISRNDYSAPSTSNDSGNITSTLAEQPIETDFKTYGLDIGYDFVAFSLSSATSYIDYSNAGDLDIGPFLGASSPFMVFTGFDSRVLSEELLLNSSHNDPWQWSLGAFYRDVEDRLEQRFQGVTALGTGGRGFVRSKSYAGFGELSRRFFHDQLKWTVGLRYFHDDIARQDSIGQALPGATFEATTPRAVLTWTPSVDVSVYGSYSQGFRSGQFQSTAVTAVAPEFPDVDPDKLNNYELGVKGGVLNQRVSFELAVFYVDWKDVQQTLQVELAPGIRGPAGINGTSASGFGADFSLTAKLVERLELGASLGWNDLTQDEEIRNASGALIFFKGDRLLYSPEYTMSGFVDYSFPIGESGLDARFSGSVNYSSSQDSMTGGTRTGRRSGDDMTVGRASFSLEAADHWTAMLYVDNINNEKETVLPGLFSEFDSRLRPRTVGLQLEFQY